MIEFTDSSSYITILNPATERPLVEVPLAGPDDVDAAVARAREAFPGWRALGPVARAGLLRALAARIDGELEELARLEVANSGHPIGAARWEPGNARDVFEYYAGAPERLAGRQIPVAGGIDLTFHEPLASSG